MSEDVIRDDARGGAATTPPTPLPGDDGNVADLKREVDRLRELLAKVTVEAESYRRAAYAMLNEQVPYVPPTEDELRNLMYGPRGRSILEIIDEIEREGAG